MQNKNFLNQKKGSTVLNVLLFLFVFAVAACNSNEKKEANEDGAEDKGGTKKALSFHYLKYDSTTIANWLAYGKKTARFIFQFSSPQAGRYDTAFRAIAYVQDSTGNYSNGTAADQLAVDHSMSPKKFSGQIYMGNNMISRTRMIKAISDKNGNPLSYDYLLFIPKTDMAYYVVYELKIYKAGKLVAEYEGEQETKPSPPAPPGGDDK
jgi:hypothetical protein